MARRKTKREEEYLSGSLVAMIDVVFQLIIFFVCTTTMADKAIDDRIVLPDAPHGIPQDVKDPNEFRVDVDKKGNISLLHSLPITQSQLTGMLKAAAVNTKKGQDLPVVIRADGGTKHAAVRKVMDACTEAGIWKIKFVAVKEAAKKASD